MTTTTKMQAPELSPRSWINLPNDRFETVNEITIDGYHFKLGDRVNVNENDNGEVWFSPWGFDCGFIDYIMVSKSKRQFEPNTPLCVSIKVRIDEHTTTPEYQFRKAETGLYSLDINGKSGYTITPYIE